MRQALVIITVLLLGLSLFHPPYPREQYLQHAPTIVLIAVLFEAARKQRISKLSFASITIFLWLHILGARYVYSFVPYDEWLRQWFSADTGDWFDWQRNHYDRLVHLCFGMLFLLPIAGFVVDRARISVGCGVGIAVLAVLAFSAIYEVLEWLLTVFMSPRDAEAYNGQQGDFWDAQKDMALVFAGSLVAMPVVACILSPDNKAGR